MYARMHGTTLDAAGAIGKASYFHLRKLHRPDLLLRISKPHSFRSDSFVKATVNPHQVKGILGWPLQVQVRASTNPSRGTRAAFIGASTLALLAPPSHKAELLS